MGGSKERVLMAGVGTHFIPQEVLTRLGTGTYDNYERKETGPVHRAKFSDRLNEWYRGKGGTSKERRKFLRGE